MGQLFSPCLLRRALVAATAWLAAALLLTGCAGDGDDSAAEPVAGGGGDAAHQERADDPADREHDSDPGDVGPGSRGGEAMSGGTDGAAQRGPLRVVAADRRATRLAERAGGGLFAHFERLEQVRLYDLGVDEDGSPSVRNRSGDVSPGWGSFQGREFAHMRHARQGQRHALVIDENRAGGQRMIVISTDDGDSFTRVPVGDAGCGEVERGAALLPGGLPAITSAASCASPAPADLGIVVSGAFTPTVTPGEAVCGTDEVLAHIRPESAGDGTVWPVRVTADGQEWREVPLPGLDQPEQLDQKWLRCAGDAFVVYSQSGLGLLFGADGSGGASFEIPVSGPHVNPANGSLVAWGSSGGRSDVVVVSDDGGATWEEVGAAERRISDAAVDGDGHVWVLAGSEILTTAPSGSEPSQGAGPGAGAATWPDGLDFQGLCDAALLGLGDLDLGLVSEPRDIHGWRVLGIDPDAAEVVLWEEAGIVHITRGAVSQRYAADDGHPLVLAVRERGFLLLIQEGAPGVYGCQGAG